jgi:hypothetical protein
VGLLNKFEALFKRRGANGRVDSNDPLENLQDSYRELRRLAAQVADHAARAPYSGVAERLKRIAAEKQASADLLRDKLVAAYRSPDQTALEIESGGNHWERMGRDLNDHSVLETRLLERAARIEEKSSDIAELLRQVARVNSHHVRDFMDLIARADPQANLT